MSRVINVNSPAKVRNYNRRTIAELLRQLSSKPSFDAEAKDMAALLVFALREIDAGITSSVEAWEKRGYWMKAERFLRDWEWTKQMAADFDDVIRHEAWDLLPQLLIDLYPHFADIQIKTMTRSAKLWQGAYKQLLAEPPLSSW